MDREREENPPSPENIPTKIRALVVYGTGESKAWDTPLINKDGGNSPICPSQVRLDLTKGDKETSESTNTISQLTQDLAFLRKDFNDSIQSNNNKRDEENVSFIDKVLALQKYTDTSIDNLSSFIKGNSHGERYGYH